MKEEQIDDIMNSIWKPPPNKMPATLKRRLAPEKLGVQDFDKLLSQYPSVPKVRDLCETPSSLPIPSYSDLKLFQEQNAGNTSPQASPRPRSPSMPEKLCLVSYEQAYKV
jgi:hypothetical protein